MSDSDVSDVTFVPRYLEGQSAVTIQHVSCGDFFTACITGLCLSVHTRSLSLSLALRGIPSRQENASARMHRRTYKRTDNLQT